MTLARSILLRIAAMLAALAAVGAVALWGLTGLRGDLAGALDQYDQLRLLYSAGLPIASARQILHQESGSLRRALGQLTTARQRLEQLPRTEQNGLLCQRLCDDLDQAIALLQTQPDAQDLAAAGGALNHALNQMGRLVNATRKNINRINEASARRLGRTIWLVGLMTGLFVVVAAGIGLWQYRAVMGPLRRLDRGARYLAAGHFDQRLPTGGYAELAALSAQFNRMAEELEGLYRGLEEKVRRTGAELARSERLASVGYLAAGVAHEINNPLAIIATHAELTLDQLKRRPDRAAVEQAAEALQVICDEAFRCKAITEKLLGLARRQTDRRGKVDLEQVARQVVGMVGSMPQYRPVELVVDFAHPCPVRASQGEMTQVLLNLVTNALAAVDRQTGRVRLTGRRDGPVVRVCVEDNGRGMDAATLERVFEPFYSCRPAGSRGGEGGTGLGLSIVHAIISDHGGRITAASDGPGRGSRFVIELPAWQEDRPDGSDRPDC